MADEPNREELLDQLVNLGSGGQPSREMILRGLGMGADPLPRPSLSGTQEHGQQFMPWWMYPILAATGIGGARPPRNVLAQLRRANEVGNWLTRSGVNYSTETSRTGSGTIYLQARHPTTGETVTIRFPSEGHMGYVGSYRPGPNLGENARIGSRFDTGTVPHRTMPELPEYTRNVSGELYGSNPQVLLNALRYRFSASPPGENWLIPPGSQPQMPISAPPIPMTRSPVMFGNTTRPASTLSTQDIMSYLASRTNLPPTRRVTLPPRQLPLPLP